MGFTGVELAGGAERTAPVEKAVAGRSSGEGGRRAGEGREAEWGARGRWSMARRGMGQWHAWCGMGARAGMERADGGRAMLHGQERADGVVISTV